MCVYFKPSSSFDAMQETFFQIRCFAAMVKQNNNMENDIIGKSNIKKYVEHQMKKSQNTECYICSPGFGWTLYIATISFLRDDKIDI